MNEHVKYLKYVLKHKWYVFKECYRLGIPWRGIVHDISKLYPSEWFPYTKYFYGENGNAYGIEDEIEQKFDKAWLKHQNRNKHHWQYWVLLKDDGNIYPIDMPIKYVKEMYADWVGAHKATNNKSTVIEWYEKNELKMLLSPTTIKEIERMLYDKTSTKNRIR